MAGSAIRHRWFGFANIAGSKPAAAGQVTVRGTSVIIPFGEKLRSGPAAAQFASSVGTVSAVAVDGTNLRITLSGAITPGQAVTITYTQSGTAGLRLADVFNDECVSPSTFVGTGS